MYTQEQVLQVLRNMGHDPECGACMAIAFTGAGRPDEQHTCGDERAKLDRTLDGGLVRCVCPDCKGHREFTRCDPENACATHRRCWVHSHWSDETTSGGS